MNLCKVCSLQKELGLGCSIQCLFHKWQDIHTFHFSNYFSLSGSELSKIQSQIGHTNVLTFREFTLFFEKLEYYCRSKEVSKENVLELLIQSSGNCKELIHHIRVLKTKDRNYFRQMIRLTDLLFYLTKKIYSIKVVKELSETFMHEQVETNANMSSVLLRFKKDVCDLYIACFCMNVSFPFNSISLKNNFMHRFHANCSYNMRNVLYEELAKRYKSHEMVHSGYADIDILGVFNILYTDIKKKRNEEARKKNGIAYKEKQRRRKSMIEIHDVRREETTCTHIVESKEFDGYETTLCLPTSSSIQVNKSDTDIYGIPSSLFLVDKSNTEEEEANFFSRGLSNICGTNKKHMLPIDRMVEIDPKKLKRYMVESSENSVSVESDSILLSRQKTIESDNEGKTIEEVHDTNSIEAYDNIERTNDAENEDPSIIPSVSNETDYKDLQDNTINYERPLVYRSVSYIEYCENINEESLNEIYDRRIHLDKNMQGHNLYLDFSAYDMKKCKERLDAAFVTKIMCFVDAELDSSVFRHLPYAKNRLSELLFFLRMKNTFVSKELSEMNIRMNPNFEYDFYIKPCYVKNQLDPVDYNPGSNVLRPKFEKYFSDYPIINADDYDNRIEEETIYENYEKLGYISKVDIPVSLMTDLYREMNYIYTTPNSYVAKNMEGESILAVDYTILNEMIVDDKSDNFRRFPSRILKCIMEISTGKQYFSRLKVTPVLWNILLEPDCRKYTIFCNASCEYFVFNVLPFGLKNSQYFIHSILEKIFLDKIQKGYLLVYADEILISSDDALTHMHHLEDALLKIHTYGFQIKEKHSTFYETSVYFAGFHVSASFLGPCKLSLYEPEHKLYFPHSIAYLRFLLSFLNHYSVFIPNLGETFEPLLGSLLLGEGGLPIPPRCFQLSYEKFKEGILLWWKAFYSMKQLSYPDQSNDTMYVKIHTSEEYAMASMEIMKEDLMMSTVERKCVKNICVKLCNWMQSSTIIQKHIYALIMILRKIIERDYRYYNFFSIHINFPKYKCPHSKNRTQWSEPSTDVVCSPLSSCPTFVDLNDLNVESIREHKINMETYYYLYLDNSEKIDPCLKAWLNQNFFC